MFVIRGDNRSMYLPIIDENKCLLYFICCSVLQCKCREPRTLALYNTFLQSKSCFIVPIQRKTVYPHPPQRQSTKVYRVINQRTTWQTNQYTPKCTSPSVWSGENSDPTLSPQPQMSETKKPGRTDRTEPPIHTTHDILTNKCAKTWFASVSRSPGLSDQEISANHASPDQRTMSISPARPVNIAWKNTPTATM